MSLGTAKYQRLSRSLQLVLCKTLLPHNDAPKLHKPPLLSCEVSPYVVGAVLAHKDDQGRGAPTPFVSKRLGAPAEKNYFRLDCEGLAVVFGVVHLHQYLAGR